MRQIGISQVTRELRRLASKVLAKGLIDQSFDSIAGAVRGVDLILIAVPIGQFRRVFEKVDAARDSRSVVTDAGSTKGGVIRDIASALGSIPAWFVPGHPIAGSEQSGVDAANPDLYVDHQVILTPDLNTDADAIDLVSSFGKSKALLFLKWMLRDMMRSLLSLVICRTFSHSISCMHYRTMMSIWRFFDTPPVVFAISSNRRKRPDNVARYQFGQPAGSAYWDRPVC